MAFFSSSDSPYFSLSEYLEKQRTDSELPVATFHCVRSIRLAVTDSPNILSSTESAKTAVHLIHNCAFFLAFAFRRPGLDLRRRLTETRNGVLTNYTYDEDNRLNSKGTAAYSYDDNGNLVQKNDGGQTANYTWDYENRLTDVALPGGTISSYEYTTDGKMLSRNQSGVKTWFAYDFAEVNGYDDMIAEYNATGVLQTRYVHGPGIDEPLAIIRGGTTKYCLRDALGSVTGLASGQALSTVYHYEAFGETRAWSGMVDHYGFTSRELDPSSDLHFYRARWYDSEVGRFMSKDPAGFIDGLNLYAYVRNNPVNLIDPSGNGCWFGGTWCMHMVKHYSVDWDYFKSCAGRNYEAIPSFFLTCLGTCALVCWLFGVCVICMAGCGPGTIVGVGLQVIWCFVQSIRMSVTWSYDYYCYPEAIWSCL